jgi:2-aminoadipate transaminase
MTNTATLTMSSDIPLADWTRAISRSALQDMLIASARPEILSFALGLPAAELFPTEKYAQSLVRVLSTDPRSLQYGPPLLRLKQQVLAIMELRGVHCREEQIFLTAGAQQGMNMLTRLLLNPGGRVIMEQMTYPGFQQVLQPYRPIISTVPTDLETGLDVDAVERLLVQEPKPSLIYSVADGHNPLSVSMSVEKRRRLVELARRFRVPIIEDDPYGLLFYGDSCMPPLRSFEADWVCYVGTFSKILAPGVRTGWLVVPENLVAPLSVIKESMDINMAPLNQRAISDYVETGELWQHLPVLRAEYRRRRDAMLLALEKHFPMEARWRRPASGLFCWVELLAQIDGSELLRLAIETEKIAFIPGFAFHAGNGACCGSALRLNFSANAPHVIEDGIARLARIVKQLIGRNGIVRQEA